jgi:hypothetical protein
LAGGLDSLVELAKRNDNDLVIKDLVLRVALEAARDAELASALDDLLLFRGRRASPRFWRTPPTAAKYPLVATGHWSPTS